MPSNRNHPLAGVEIPIASAPVRRDARKPEPKRPKPLGFGRVRRQVEADLEVYRAEQDYGVRITG